MFNELPPICAIATPSGKGAISVIRVSGYKAIELLDHFFVSPNKKKWLTDQETHTIHFGNFMVDGKIIDEVLVSVFKNPHSYTGEDTVEISCHASRYIQQSIILALLDVGVEVAGPGEFTMRAFLNGKMDLSQAEGVADLIAAQSEAAHRIAMDQLRGGFSKALQELRSELLKLISLIELELDFSEEDVEFADRESLKILVNKIRHQLKDLIDSFRYGNAIKDGIPVVIAGKPNVGKSTLLNLILREEKAIVSAIPGTTRDSIEDVCVLEGVQYRFIDTAGLRETDDEVERIGIQRAKQKIRESSLMLYLLEASMPDNDMQDLMKVVAEEWPDKQIIWVVNKMDWKENAFHWQKEFSKSIMHDVPVYISALQKEGINELKERMKLKVNELYESEGGVVVSNARHYEALKRSDEAAERVLEGLSGSLSTDLIAEDIRQILHYLGEITGTISNDEILGHIFSEFCIGK